jgi:endonuclease/exonuclease/phosphatase family metal-dependent hydrolase
MILSRLPVKQAFATLPCPAGRCAEHAARRSRGGGRAAFGDVRVITTHLEYYSRETFGASEALRPLCRRIGYAGGPRIKIVDEGPYQAFSRPAATIITGDFNLEPDDPLRADVGAVPDGTPPLADGRSAPESVTRRPFAFTKRRSPEIDFIAISSSSAKICDSGCARSMSIRKRRSPITNRSF